MIIYFVSALLVALSVYKLGAYAMLISLLILTAKVVIAVIMVFVIPVVKAMFEGMGGSLPLSTQLVVHMSDFIKNLLVFFYFFNT